MTILDTPIADAPPIQVNSDGVARVGGTRVRLETVLVAFNNGAAAGEVVLRYPSLDLGDVYSVIAYYLRHRTEIDAYLDERARAAAAAAVETEQRFPARGVRERLLARRGARP